DVYGRVYMEPDSNNNVRPLAYIGTNEYKDVLFNDQRNIIFFYETSTRSFQTSRYQSVINAVFMLDLLKCYPAITHRADEEAHSDVSKLLEKGGDLVIQNLVTRQSNVLSDFSIPETIILDTHPRHLFRVEMLVNYKYLKSC
ncbi:MAG: hypothetical protein ACOC10_09475, partial [Bacteroidota bacterium]